MAPKGHVKDQINRRGAFQQDLKTIEILYQWLFCWSSSVKGAPPSSTSEEGTQSNASSSLVLLLYKLFTGLFLGDDKNGCIVLGLVILAAG